MQIFVSYEGNRTQIYVEEKATAGELKDLLRQKIYVESELHVESEDGSTRERKILALFYGGAELNDKWVLADVGVFPGSTLRAIVKEEKQPNVYIYVAYNQNIIPVIDNISIKHTLLTELRSVASRRTFLPVGVFRLVTKDGQEMFDCHTLEYYNVDVGETIRLEVWDGWPDLLNLCVMGFTSNIMATIRQSRNPYVKRYQMKVALYLAACYGHVDLALNLLKSGLKPFDATGYHPWRQWCRDTIFHIDSLKTPVHVAAECGSVDVMRVFVTNNIFSLFSQDGKDLMPWNIALRNKQKGVAVYLLAKQFTKVEFGNSGKHIPLKLCAKMKIWAEKAREKTFIKYGALKSTLRRNAFINRGVLVGQGVHVDGYTPSSMMSRAAVKPLHRKLFANTEPKSVTHVLRDDSDDEDILKSRGSSAASEFRLPPLHTKSPRPETAASYIHTGAHPDTTEEEHIEKELNNLELNNNKPTTSKSEAAKRNSSTGKGRDSKPLSRLKRKERSTKSALRLARSKTEGFVSLPEVSIEGRNRPFFFSLNKEDPRTTTLKLVEKYRGMTSRDYAIRCLAASNNFTERPWLHQVRMAVTLAACGIKRSLKDSANIRSKRRTRTL